ncbi:neuraminidase-like domain-containing protein [Aeromonas popoffii]|uniref:Tc toxin subunit A-related protein n=1 Tax=Aeromonas popoffii TaxID=70856 RepID=UPI0030CB1D3E
MPQSEKRGNMMYCTTNILDKLNVGLRTVQRTALKEDTPPISLADMTRLSFAEINNLAKDILSWGEKNFLCQQAQEAWKENKLTEARIFSRANPQLDHALGLSLQSSAMQRGYDDLFGGRASKFVKPGAVASMFSPAAYLTELYREARKLHSSDSPHQLDKRRPDLSSLVLSQGNMDEELTTLSLSNELLRSGIQAKEGKEPQEVMEMLATYRFAGTTPFHLPYEASRQSLLLKDPEFTAFQHNPAVASTVDTASLLTLMANIPPDLYRILTEEITTENTEQLIKKNFGDNVDPSQFQDKRYLANYYELTYEELSQLLGAIENNNDNIDPAKQHYTNNRLIRTVKDDGTLSVRILTRIGGGNNNQYNYVELIPVGGNRYKIQLSAANAADKLLISIGTEGAGSNNLVGDATLSGLNKPASFDVTIDSQSFKDGLPIGITRHTSPGAGYYYATYKFEQVTFHPNMFLLKLNKLIRLYKATGMTPDELLTVIENNNTELVINNDVISQLFWVHFYMQRYGIDVSSALALCGSTITTQTDSQVQASAFDRLFNTPPLNGQVFYVDGTKVKLKPDEIDDSFRSSVLKRAFQVNDAELYTLWALAQGSETPPDFLCTLENLSALYRVKLMADVHDLDVTELAMLISVSPYAGKMIAGLNLAELNGVVQFLDDYTRWLCKQGWSCHDLYLMTTSSYSTELSPDIQNLLDTLNNGLANQDFAQANATDRMQAVAPLIAAATQLDSTETAAAILQWLEQLQPGKLDVTAFLSLAAKDKPSDAETVQLVTFCQVMRQLTLAVRALALNSVEILLAVSQPSAFSADVKTLPHTIATLHTLARFHTCMQRCGTKATTTLFALGNKSLTPVQLAQAMALDEQMLAQGLAQQNSSAETFNSWTDMDAALQWVDVAATLGITPAAAGLLAKINYAADSQHPSYQEWEHISHILQAGLDSRQRVELQTTLDEVTSTALGAYFVKNIAPNWVTNRDQLYRWLLVDNKVSAQVKTTRLAEAIASVQLYINRALAGQEEGVDNLVKGRAFFHDWDAFNKRYSSWAGLSQLVYYPENYLDPTLRIGQTGMMDEMLQSLSQSQLNSDTVEGAFKTYMRRFEEIANLDIISGYHDSASDKEGITYLIGRSAIGDYYWRSVDIGKMADGKLPANAWSEWKKTTVAVSAVGDLVRPVIFQSRLYIVWVEERQAQDKDKPQPTSAYSLKYAHILHDGNWSSPISHDVEKSVLLTGSSKLQQVGMYCAESKKQDALQQKMLICFFEKKDLYRELPSDFAGFSISANGNIEETDGTSSVFSRNCYKQLDTLPSKYLNTPNGGAKYHISAPKGLGYTWGANDYTIIFGCGMSGLSVGITDKDCKITFDAKSRVVYYGYGGSRSSDLVKLMKAVGKIDEIFYFPNFVSKGSYAAEKNFETELLIKKSNSTLYIECSDNYINEKEGGYKPHYAMSAFNPTTSYQMSYVGNRIWSKSDTHTQFPENVYICRSNPFPNVGSDFWYSDFRLIKTGINLGDMYVSANNKNQTILSASSCDKYSLGESLFSFKNKEIVIPLAEFNNGRFDLELTLSGKAQDGRVLGSEKFGVTIYSNEQINTPSIALEHTSAGCQYLQYGVHRIRVNTLFAKQLVARANAGLKTVLSMETQQLQEPKLGQGTYVTLELSKYDPTIHGKSKEFVIYDYKVWSDNSKDSIYRGTLNDHATTTVNLFLPRMETFGDYDCLYIFAKYESGETNDIQFYRSDKSNPNGWYLNREYKAGTFKGLVSVSNLDRATDPMDFSGANALYFWEMFYYVPMMVFSRLLQEGCFNEATQWLNYIWSPNGYLEYGQPATYQWNVRPLQEDTGWNANPLDSVDPDAVSQSDPMHYKVATFMAMLDLLIARGDAAYRLLERDSLNEAKVWYTQALDILGDEPYLSMDADWNSPTLSKAADDTMQVQAQQALMQVRELAGPRETRSANSLTALFLPQQNEKLKGYWQTLTQRLYNLRHNLSIDGQPLSLSIYSAPMDPAALLSAAVNATQGGDVLPKAIMPLHRFPVMLESARAMSNQLSQFGSTLLSISERQDAEALSELLQTQGSELMRQSIALQQKTITEIDADHAALKESRVGALARQEHYTQLYDENVSSGETQAMGLYLASSTIATSSQAVHMAAAAADMVPNIYGLAVGGSRYGALFNAAAIGMEISAGATRIAADKIGQSETYRRRRQEWQNLRDNAKAEVKQLDAQLDALSVRREAAVLQQVYLETQQIQAQAQLSLLRNKFTSKALYCWLRGKLAAIYRQFYDLTLSRCLMAQEAYKWALGTETASFIRSGTWQGSQGGLMAGETLLLNLAQMEQSYLQKDQREKEVTRTTCLSTVYAGAFDLADNIHQLVNKGSGSTGSSENGLRMTSDKQLQATLKLSDLKIVGDYPAALGKTRRIKQISVTLPALVGPYQDVRAVLSYGGSVVLPQGCNAMAVSHGMNDSGQFQLDFNDSRYLPFEGIPVDDAGTLTLSFPDATVGQKALLQSLNDIILHIHYTIRS